MDSKVIRWVAYGICLAALGGISIGPLEDKYPLNSTPAPFSISADTCPTGKEGHVWFLGEVGLDFNSGAAVSRPGFATRAGETQTSISDKDGNLLMYFDGEDLYDASHNIMQGGNNLNPGGRSSTQSLFLKQPGNDSMYFLFFPERYTGTDSPARDTTKSLWFSTININGNGGLGIVIGNKVRLLQPSTEKVTAIPHCNGKDYWIIGSEGGSNRFFSWLLDPDSLHQNTPTVSSSGQGNSGIGATKAGFLKPSHDGKQLCEISGIVMNLHSFNPATGIVYDGYEVINRADQVVVYGCEFSPNNSKLYLTGYYIWQLDLWAGNVQDIRNSLYQVLTDPQSNVGAPTLGPDSIIYITKSSSRNTTLFTIEKPDLLGQDCQFQEFGFDLQNGTGLGAPNWPAGFLFPDRLYTRYPDTTICLDSIAPVWITGPCDHHNTSWQLLDGGQINIVHEDSVQLTFDAPGTYRVAVQAESRCGMRYDTVELKVKNCNCSASAGSFTNTADTFNICDGDTISIPFNGDQVVSADDTLIFILHDRPDDTLGNVAATFDTPMAFYRAGLNYNQVYYFSAIVGKKSGQDIDVDDPCLSISPGVPVVFREIPGLTFIDVPTQKCKDSCKWVNAEFSGLPPFTFLVRKARQRMGQPIPAEYKTAMANQISFLWCQDTLDIGNISGRFCSSYQIDTTVAIHSIALPQITSLNFASGVCSGDSTNITFTSTADSVVLINQENNLEKTITASNILLGPFFADSCFYLKLYNRLGCPTDTSFCIQVLDLHSTRDTLFKCSGDTITLPDGSSVFTVGEYPVVLQSAAGCDSNVLFQVNNFSPLDIQVVTEMACPDQSNGVAELIHNSGSGSFSVLWPDGDTSTIRTDLKGGQYQVAVFDVNSCSSIIDVVVQEENQALFAISTNDESCLGDQDGWIALGSNSASFLFEGVSFSSGDTITDLEGGNYYIEVISPSGLCHQDTVVSIQKGEELLINLPSEIQLSSSTVELPLNITQGIANSYSWAPADFLSCVDCPRPLASPQSDIIYTVSVISENGCEATASIKILVNTNVFIPTSFTPNGDNINDEFRPYFSNMDQVYQMEIYNRWGELMYRCEGNDCAWDGAFNGQLLLPGVFVYIIEYKGADRNDVLLKGGVTLITN